MVARVSCLGPEPFDNNSACSPTTQLAGTPFTVTAECKWRSSPTQTFYCVSCNRNHPHFRIAEKALDFLCACEEILNIASRNLFEFWAAATRPFDENGLGLTVEQTAREIDRIRRFWVVVPDVPLFGEWSVW
jgi:hypothetical protein